MHQSICESCGVCKLVVLCAHQGVRRAFCPECRQAVEAPLLFGGWTWSRGVETPWLINDPAGRQWHTAAFSETGAIALIQAELERERQVNQRLRNRRKGGKR